VIDNWGLDDSPHFKIMKYKLLILSFLMLSALQIEAQVTTITPDEAIVKLKKKKTIVLDVRTQQEFSEGHLPNAVNIDVLDSVKFVQQIQMLKKRKQYVVYCRSGKRSLKASEILVNNKFKNIYNMEGGILEWKQPLQKEK
jgi:rhodanese-related sulfurtransferase